MTNNSTYMRPVIPAGNSFFINIALDKFIDGAYAEFDLTKATDLKVYLICATHNTEIPLPYEIIPGIDNVLKCFVDWRLLHTTSYGIAVEGYDEHDIHFRFLMLPKEGFLVVNNTSGMKVTDDVQVIDISGRVGWGIQVDADLSNYYTKTQTDTLLDNKQDTLVSGTNIKTINNESILGEGNIEIQGGGGEQVQSDWTELDTEDPAYIKHKPDLSVYATQSQLSNYYDKGQTDGLLNNKVDTSTLVEDYYNKNTVNNLLDTKADTSDLNSYYDKTQTDTLLNQKANTSDLNTKQDTLVSGTNIKTINSQSVLGSGNIEITIPQQVQSDWNQTDNTAVDYIKNKPTIPDTSNFVQTTEANSANEATANSLYNLNERLGSAEFSIKTIPTELQAQIDTLKSDVDEVSASMDAQFEDIDNEFKTLALIINNLHNVQP